MENKHIERASRDGCCVILVLLGALVAAAAIAGTVALVKATIGMF